MKSISVTVQGSIEKNIKEVFQFIVPIGLHLLFQKKGILPVVKRTSNTGVWYQAGMTRTVFFDDGATALEKLTNVSEFDSFSYEISHFTSSLKKFVYSINGTWNFTDKGNDRTDVAWTYSLVPSSFMGSIIIHLLTKARARSTLNNALRIVKDMLMKQTNTIRFTHIRHASSLVEVGGKKIIIDPMLSDKQRLPSIILTKNKQKNPLTDLPFDVENISTGIDHVLLTHLHFDHFDTTAIQKIPKAASIICSKPDRKKLQKLGFSNIHPVSGPISIDDLGIERYPARHGRGLLRLLLGRGSSYVLVYKGVKIFITGDCLLTKALKKELIETKPDIVIANGGAAAFKFGKPITMTIKDIQQISKLLPNSKIFVVHLDTLNHCAETRLHYFDQMKAYPAIHIPADGETIEVAPK
jgi:L-ascorbate metabolism protein UlaG (beta-lactamase superfamily)